MSDSTTPATASGSADPDLVAGQAVGEYQVDEKIGQGGFGTVFRATHPLIGKVVAIKVLARKFSVDPEMVSRFIAEARAVNQIRHRHIIDIFSFGQLEDGRHYYMMEYLEGEPLDQLLEREGRLPLGEALPILRAVARALDAAHAKGIAHRDLKPENVFLAHDPEGAAYPKLLDFGIAKLLGPEDGLKQKTRTGIPMGTPYYMSPEQCRGRDVDHRTDFYAFGVMAYQLLTGEFPLDAEDFMTILMKQVSETAPPASSKNPALPPGIDEALAWLMEKDPANRPPTLMTAIRALEQAAIDGGVQLPITPTSAFDVQTNPEARLSAQQRNATPTPSRLRNTPGPAAAALQTVAPDVEPLRSRRGLAIGAALGMVVVAVAVFALVRSHGTDEPVVPPAAVAPVVPAPPAAPKPEPVVTPPAAPKSVIVDITGLPDGAELTVDGQPSVVGPIKLPRGTEPVVLTFKADGYYPLSKSVIPDRDQPLPIALKKKPVTRPSTGGKKVPSKDDLATPNFGK